jgi:leader peptidase (prepilin peptidase)/N-methyltransferase
MEELTSPFFGIFVFIFGTVMGSFLNVLSDRLPNEETIFGRSHCEDCKHTLRWYDLFPVLSFVFLKGKCRYCKKKLSWYYPFSEIFTGVVFVLVWFFVNMYFSTGLSESLIFTLKCIYLVITSALLVIFYADLKYQIIPDSMQAILVVSGLAVRLLVSGFKVDVLFYALIEAFIIMAPLLLLYMVTRGRGMGFGDVKLAFGIGLLFGLKIGAMVLYIAFITGAVIGVIMIITKKKKMKSKMAFGPFLVLGMFVAMFYHAQLLQFIKRIWGV